MLTLRVPLKELVEAAKKVPPDSNVRVDMNYDCLILISNALNGDWPIVDGYVTKNGRKRDVLVCAACLQRALAKIPDVELVDVSITDERKSLIIKFQYKRSKPEQITLPNSELSYSYC